MSTKACSISIPILCVFIFYKTETSVQNIVLICCFLYIVAVSRIFSHALFHKGPWHLAVTIIPIILLGTQIERELGSILFSLVLISCWLISTLMEVAMTTLLYHVAHDLFHVCSLGLSGVEFGLMALVTNFLKSDKCSLGCCCLPYNVVPWGCLFLYYAAFHRGSIFMHIGGLAAGYARIFIF